MRKFLFVIPVMATFLFSCKSYMYYTPPVNAPVFANKGEVQVSAGVGQMGWNARGGASITDHIAVEGMYTGPYSTAEYHMRETEFGLGLYTGKPDSKRGQAYCIYGGYAWGNNSKLDSGAVLKDYYGNYNRVFVAIGGGSTKSALFEHVKVGGVWALKVNYMTYYGYKESNNAYNQFWASNVFAETYLAGTIGGKHVRFEYGTGFPVKLDFKWAENPSHNIRIFPLHFNLGLQIIIGRHYD